MGIETGSCSSIRPSIYYLQALRARDGPTGEEADPDNLKAQVLGLQDWDYKKTEVNHLIRFKNTLIPYESQHIQPLVVYPEQTEAVQPVSTIIQVRCLATDGW